MLVPATGQAAVGEQVSSYDVDMTLQRDGTMHVAETIAYDFGSTQHHGITREIPTEFNTSNNDEIRVYPISNVRVSSPTGAPADVKESDNGADTELRIGDPDQTVSGQQTYLIAYDVKGVLNGFEDHQELYWNAIGTDTAVPILRATATVEGPAAITKTACFRGQQGSTDTCVGTIGANGAATFSATDLQPNQGMSVVTSFPLATFSSTAPIIKQRQTLARAFSLTPLSVGGFGVIFLALAGGAIAMVMRRGRDEQYLGVTPGLEPGFGQDEVTRKVGWMNRDVVAVQFQPPKDMRPGQLGTLIDEHANVIDVTATIIDLAVRGYLRIDEIPKEGWLGKTDWRLVELTPAPAAPLLRYEEKLFNALFQGRSEVLLSELKQTFASDLSSVQSMLYADVTENGWFRGNPSSVRTAWQFGAIAMAAGGIALTWLLATRTRYGLIGAAVALAGLVMLVLAPRMPARTPKGTALLAQARGFKLYLTKAEASQIKWEEGQDIFSRYLPYAIVFGVADRWARVFNELARSGANLAEPTWYSGSSLHHGVFNYLVFSSVVDDFATTTSGSIAAATPSSSGSSGFGGGGFSGGGGGGGGVGSW